MKAHPLLVVLVGMVGCTDTEQMPRSTELLHAAAPAGAWHPPSATAAPAARLDPGTASPDWHNPRQACTYLANLGFATDTYSPMGDRWYCHGSRIITLNPTGPPNEVNYTPEGTASRVEQIVISTEHFNNNPGDEQFTLARASLAADSVLEKVFGDKAPRAAAEALRNGRTGEWEVADAVVEVERESYPTGKGYQMYFRIRDRGSR